jgi:phospholipase C
VLQRRLARSYAISDRWYASSPTQTWPNRAFVHLGTSCGKVNSAPNNPFDYGVPTIFNVLEEFKFTPRGELVTWGVYNDTILPSLTRLQLPRLWNPLLDGHFHSFETLRSMRATALCPPTVLSNPVSRSTPMTSIRRMTSGCASNSFTMFIRR